MRRTSSGVVRTLALLGGGWFPQVAVAQGTTTNPPVTGIVAQVTAQGIASVSWDAFPKASKYFVVRWNASDANCCKGMSPPALSGSTLSWQDGTLPRTGTYGYRVYATTSAGTYAGGASVYYQPGVATTSQATGQTSTSLIPGATGGSTTTSLGSMPSRTTYSALQSNTAPAPTGLQVTGGVNTASLTWNPVSGATGYEVRRTVAGTTNWTLLTPTPTTGITYPGQQGVDVVPDHKQRYTYQVSAIQADGRVGSATVDFTPAAPQDPSAFSAVQTGDGAVDLSWSPPPSGSKFLLTGPGLGNGVVVDGVFSTTDQRLHHQVTGVPLGSATWTIATNYEKPGGVLTAPATWPKASLTIVTLSGRYRVTMYAFDVKTQTREGVALDGFGDEVYLAAFVAAWNMATATWGPKSIPMSVIFGDVNGASGRVLAGTASPQGGLKTGDVFPVGGGTASPAPPNTNTFPMLLWEGTLTDDNDLILIAPSVWESDGNDVNYSQWTKHIDRELPSVLKSSSMVTEIAATWINPVPAAGTSGPIVTTGPVVDHPIGMTSTIAYSQQYLALTRRRIEAALSAPGRFGVGLAAGVIAVTMTDLTNFTNFGGSYTVYLRVERAP